MRGLWPWGLAAATFPLLQIAVPALGRDGDGGVYLIIRDIVIEKSICFQCFQPLVPRLPGTHSPSSSLPYQHTRPTYLISPKPPAPTPQP
jgi:hypothetical protein